MNPRSIAKLRRTFIAIATASFLVVILVMGGLASAFSILAVTDEANRTIDAIIDANGDTPTEGNFRNGPFHEEASLGLRFFTVSFDSAGNVESIDLSHIASVDYDMATTVSKMAEDPDDLVKLGRFQNYLYKEGETANGSMIVFLDCSVQIASARATVINILIVCIAAVVVTFTSVVFFSRRAIRPEVENVKRQQQFITNASHELKTPIAVIRANTELTEMMSGETEWTQSTMRQVDRLDGLVRDLITIARGEEAGSSDDVQGAVDVTSVVSAVVESFKSVAQQNGIALESSVEGGVSLISTKATVEQLSSLLIDNAIKYCDESGTVRVRLSKMLLGKGCMLAVSNDYAEGAGVDYQRFFDRFYREDTSHENQQGYGIGLSVAESICKRHHGSIKVAWKAGVITFTCNLKDA